MEVSFNKARCLNHRMCRPAAKKNTHISYTVTVEYICYSLVPSEPSNLVCFLRWHNFNTLVY